MNDFKWRHFQGEIILQCVRWYSALRSYTPASILVALKALQRTSARIASDYLGKSRPGMSRGKGKKGGAPFLRTPKRLTGQSFPLNNQPSDPGLCLETASRDGRAPSNWRRGVARCNVRFDNRPGAVEGAWRRSASNCWECGR